MGERKVDPVQLRRGVCDEIGPLRARLKALDVRRIKRKPFELFIGHPGEAILCLTRARASPLSRKCQKTQQELFQ
eukprot:7420385-Pyramimonas_sp.AAC.1